MTLFPDYVDMRNRVTGRGVDALVVKICTGVWLISDLE